MGKPKILFQFDSDRHPSVFDAVVAVDSQIDHLFQYGAIQPDQVRDLVHGTMFTRGSEDLRSTAIFVGGSNVAAGEELVARIRDCFFGPMRVSVMMDSNGANTTAAAAVLAAARHADLRDTTATVLAATGPVGQRVARLLARQGAKVHVASRSLERARTVADQILAIVPDARLEAVQAASAEETAAAVTGARIVISAGAFGVELLSAAIRRDAAELRVAIDLNAVPPLGLEGVEVTDKAVERNGVTCYGAIGVGGTKMKIHKAAIAGLFEKNDQVLDAEEIFAIGQQIEQASGS